MNYTRDPFTSKLFRVNLKWILSELPTELEALRESPELTVKTETVGHVNITSNWISEIQQCFWSTQQPYGRTQYFNRQLLGNNILAFNFWIDFIDFIFLYFYHHLCIYCNGVHNHVMSYTDVYTEAVVISMFKEWHACDVLDETNQLTGNVSLCKVCPPMIVQKIEWVHFNPVGSQYFKSNLIKILLTTNLKNLFLD